MAKTSREGPTPTSLSTVSQDFLDAPIDRAQGLGRQASNPQFQRLNLAPYLKESRELVKGRESARMKVGSSLKLGPGHSLLPKTDIQEGRTTATRFRGSQVLDEAASSVNMVLTTAHSRPVISQATGLQAMTPLGPALASQRSHSRLGVEQLSARHAGQQALTRQQKMNLLSHLEARALM